MVTGKYRFAAMLSIHLGLKPLEVMPGGSGGRGLHYTTDGSILDVWHRLAVRINQLQQLEDR